jgi:nitrite reductase/ring-hydroxylating ferredoxin subunit/multimeric flavodoxin WrbA
MEANVSYSSCQTAARVSVPFTEGRYYGKGERPNTELADNSPFAHGRIIIALIRISFCAWLGARALAQEPDRGKMNNKRDDYPKKTHGSLRFQYLCPTSEIAAGRSKQFTIHHKDTEIEIAVFNIGEKFFAISNTCQHKGGPLSKGILEGNIVTCPWHGWKYSVVNGKSPHKGGDSVNSHETKIIDRMLYVSPIPTNIGKKQSQAHKEYMQLEKSVRKHVDRRSGNDSLPPTGGAIDKTRVLGISTTNLNDKVAPRKSTSEAAIVYALDYAKNSLGAETLLIKLRDLHFKHCEGYYSKDARACIFPCSISEMNKEDQMIEIYEKLILWADVVVVGTPLSWGNASSLYYQMVQRMNCIQNQIITHDNYLIRDKAAAFIITGGQDNVQHVAGEMMSFWSQLGFVFGKFTFVGWSRGWYAEDTENNYEKMDANHHMKKDIERAMKGAVEMSKLIRGNRYDERVLLSESTRGK